MERAEPATVRIADSRLSVFRSFIFVLAIVSICALVTERQDDLVSIRTLVETGKLRSIVDRSFPLEEAAEAHRYAESGAKQSSVIISLAPWATT